MALPDLPSCPIVTAVIPVYNRAWCIERAVRSVLNQDYPGLELIAVNDGSTDNTAAILEKLQRETDAFSISGSSARTMQVLHQENRGVSAARNAAIRASQGTFVSFLDSDDEWLPRKISHQIHWFRNNPEMSINQTDEIWIRRGKRVNPNKKHWKESGDLFARSLDVCAISPSTVMIRRSLLDAVGLFDESLPACEDYDLWLRIACHHPVGLIEEPLVIKHGGHPDQLSATIPALDIFRMRSIAKLLDSGLLNETQRVLAIASLHDKCRIYSGGCRKRGRYEEARQAECLAGQYKA